MEDVTEAFQSKVQYQTEAVLKTEMLSQRLTLEHMRILRLNDENETECYINLRDNKIFLRRWFEYNNKPEEIQDVKNMICFKLESVDEHIKPELYKALVAVDSPKLEWKWDDMKHHYKIPFNAEHDLARVTWKRDNVWTIEVVGVLKEYVEGFSLEDIEAVLKLAETKINQTVDKVKAILKKSVR
mgnify:CR=1 FL=1